MTIWWNKCRWKSTRVWVWLLAALMVFFLLGWVFLIFPMNSRSSVRVLVDTTELRNGDLLFRNGNGAESRFVTGISNGLYSHIGMAYQDGTGWKVVHAVPGETEDVHDIDYLKCEPIDDFFLPERACAGAMARVNCSDSLAEKALLYALDKVTRKFAFDHRYQLEDTTTYYCTELVFRAYLQVGINLADDRRHAMPMPTTDGVFIFPSDILFSPHIALAQEMLTVPFEEE